MGRREWLHLGLVAACGVSEPSRPRVVHVAAAVSLKEVLQDFEGAVERKHEDLDVVLSFAGSQVLATQIAEGAAFDVFVSADHVQIERANARGRVGEARVLARNRLVIITPAGATKVQGPRELGRPGVEVALAAEVVPAGAYAREALRGLGVLEEVLANVRTNEENVRGVVGKVVAGEVDAGIVYATDVGAGEAGKLRVLALTGAEEVVPTYEMALVGEGSEAAHLVVAELGGAEGLAALKRHGFRAP